jgi:anti-sigma factor RsiW
VICTSFENLLLAYQDLSPQDRQRLNLHLAECDGCRSYRDALEQLDSVLTQRLRGIEASEAFRSRIYSRISAPTTLTAPSFVPELLDLIGWAAVVAVVFVLTRAMFPRPEPSDVSLMINRLVPFGSAAAVVGAVWIGMRVYSELKS